MPKLIRKLINLPSMKVFRLMILILILPLVVQSVEAQIWPFKRKSSIKKASRDLKKRTQETSREPVFNPLQQMGAGSDYERHDYVWSATTAATSYKNAGNLSLASPSRFGLREGLELSSWIPLNYWAPNLFFKKEHLHKKWILSTLHGFYSATPGLSYVKNRRDTFLADSVSNVPVIISMKNQIILSRPFFNPLDCQSGQPYLVLSGGLAFDFGVPFKDEEVVVPDKHFFTPRSMAYAGKGWLVTANAQADWVINSFLIGHAGVRVLHGNFTHSPAVEQQTSFELFLNRHFAGSLGYLLSVGKLENQTLKVWPFVDLSYYFGKKKERERSLFKRKMF